MLFCAAKELDPVLIPDDLTIPQFILDAPKDTNRPVRDARADTWLIQDKTGRCIGLDELKRRTDGLANALSLRYGVKADDVVLLFSKNHVDFPVVIWAAHRLGAIVSPANPSFTAPELQYQIERTKAGLIFAFPDAESLRVARKAAKSTGIPVDRIVVLEEDGSPLDSIGSASEGMTRYEDLLHLGLDSPRCFTEYRLKKGEGKRKIALLSFSSGTTGKPKAVAIPHYAFIANIVQLAVHNDINEPYYNGSKTVVPWDSPERRFRVGDVCLGVLPFYHIYGLLMSLHFGLYAGLAVVVVPTFKYTDMLASIERYNVTHLSLVPPQAVLLCKHPATASYRHALERVRFMMMGAAPVSHEVTMQLLKVLPNAQIGQAYGMTETSTAVSMFPASQRIGTSGSAGQLMPGVVARVVRPDGSLAGFDEPGEFVVSTPSVTLGYYGDEEATRETYLDGGWVRTGDEVRIDRNMEIWVIDRLKEIMKVNGFQVAPAELEGCILDHPVVADCCVVGVPDAYSGEVPLAFVVLSDAAAALDKGKAAEEIMQHVAKNKVAYKHLKGGVEFVDMIPKNPSGKLLRRLLREKARGLRKAKM
ncbi:acetyl-CoA synthetase-like protein [Schizophyllum commune Tattone D]|nr:acetyl-CoA synthetase-like protein [Schizophyllum commune Tattone D]